mmetsp:Transcript_2284/g.4357  ORF Transcript_2284/g.4357 Transcript_2284/m.4357 type:complete len:247 (+) Transcript_2284:268-1008(+)
MINLFGRRGKRGTRKGRSKGKQAQAVDALHQLKDRVETVKQRIEFLEKKRQLCLVEAKQHTANKNKSGAMAALRRKSMFDKELEKLRDASVSLEQQAFAIENASASIDIAKGMATGRTAMQDLQQNVRVEELDTIQEEMNETYQMINEVNTALGEPTNMDVNEAELLAELEELGDLDDDELEGLDTSVVAPTKAKARKSLRASMGSLVTLPTAPRGSVKVAKPKAQEAAYDNDEAALAALQADMAS